MNISELDALLAPVLAAWHAAIVAAGVADMYPLNVEVGSEMVITVGGGIDLEMRIGHGVAYVSSRHRLPHDDSDVIGPVLPDDALDACEAVGREVTAVYEALGVTLPQLTVNRPEPLWLREERRDCIACLRQLIPGTRPTPVRCIACGGARRVGGVQADQCEVCRGYGYTSDFSRRLPCRVCGGLYEGYAGLRGIEC